MGLAGKLGGLDSHFRAQDAAVSAFSVNALVKGEVVDATPESACGGVVG